MWRQCDQSTVKSRSISSSSSPFSFSTFKDIQYLCNDDPSAPTKKSSIFHRVSLANSLIRYRSPTPPLSKRECEESTMQSRSSPSPLPCITIPDADKRIVVYITSLRVVRSTFEDCRSVQSILRGFRVSIDERDLSMDARFIKELQEIFGAGQTKLTLPRVFIGGRYIGGAEEIREVHEAGELKKFIQGLPTAEPGICSACGGYRFILCHVCNGSHKLYIDKSGFKCCTVCNENGLIRCPSRSCAPFSSPLI